MTPLENIKKGHGRSWVAANTSALKTWKKKGWEFGLFDAKGLVQSLHGLSLFKFEKP